MSTSPSKASGPHLANKTSSSTLGPSTLRETRSLRRLRSAHALSSNPGPSHPPSLISLQRQQQRTVSITKDIPSLPSHGRSRSNSDAAVGRLSSHAPSPRRNAAARKIITSSASMTKHVTLDGLLRDGPLNGDVKGGLRDMRYLVLTDGVSSDSDGMSSLRIYIWLILLRAPPLATDEYLALIHRGASPAYAKIRNDTFRTLATDPLFRRRVSEASLIRLLNAVAWKLHDGKEERLMAARPTITATVDGSPERHAESRITASRRQKRGSRTTATDGSDAGGTEPGTYVQGMNVLAAPFLYAARSETEAFVSFHRFLTRECPGYVRGAMDGVHRGLALVDRVLAIVDSKLSAYLHSKGMNAELYAFPSVLTLCACTPPLPEVLHLWDFLFAYGAHLNVLCIVAQLVMIRDTILGSPSPTKILRSFPPLQAAKVKMIAISLVKKLPDHVYDEIVMHAK